jgi:hypothetical protein
MKILGARSLSIGMCDIMSKKHGKTLLKVQIKIKGLGR